MSAKTLTTAMLAVALLCTGTAHSLQYFEGVPLFYRPPMHPTLGVVNWNYIGTMPPSRLGAIHASIAHAWHNHNVENGYHQGAAEFDWDNPNYTRYSDWPQAIDLIRFPGSPASPFPVVRTGLALTQEGDPPHPTPDSPLTIPDRTEFSVLEYVYFTPSAPRHAEVVAAYNANLQALATWTENDNPCSNSKPSWWGDSPNPAAEAQLRVPRPADFPVGVWNPSDGRNDANPDQSLWPHIWDPTLNNNQGGWKADPPWWGDSVAFQDATFRDEYSTTAAVAPTIAFGTCGATHSHTVLVAAHATISEFGVGIVDVQGTPMPGVINGYWQYFTGHREKPVNFDDHPLIDRSVVQYLGENGDLNGNGITNKELYESYLRAWNAVEYAQKNNINPAQYGRTEFKNFRPNGWAEIDLLTTFRQGRTRQDFQLWDYIQTVVGYEIGVPMYNTVLRREVAPAVYDYHPYDPLHFAGLLYPGEEPTPVEDYFRANDSNKWVPANNPIVLNAYVSDEVPSDATYQWYKDGDALPTGDPRYSGVDGPILRIHPPLDPQADSGYYWCVIDFMVEDGEDAKALVPVTITSAPISVEVFPEGALPVSGLVGLGLLGSALALAAIRRRRR